MTRSMFGLVVAGALAFGTASDAKAQVAVSVGNPFGGGFYLNTGVPTGYYNSYYGGFGAAPVYPAYAPAAFGYGYAPRAYYGPPAFYGGYAPRAYYPRVYGGGFYGGHRRGYRW